MIKNFTVLLLVITSLHVRAQKLTFNKVPLSDGIALGISIQKLARSYLSSSKSSELKNGAHDRCIVQILTGDYKNSLQTIEALRQGSTLNNGHPRYIAYELYAKAKIKQLKANIPFDQAYQAIFKKYLAHCKDEQAYSANIVFTTYDAVAGFTNRFNNLYKNITEETISNTQALALLESYFLYHVFTVTEPIAHKEIKDDENKRYLIKEDVIVSPRDGAELSVITAQKRGKNPIPAVLIFTIYADASNEKQAILAASKGYAGVVATSRGKRFSKDPIEPYKHENKDVYFVIDWISKQVWNNGQVGMYGGSYNGFTQWASMKEKVHPALKTIIPSVSAAPGIDVPMENNIFYNFPYKWIPYVSNNKFLDHSANYDFARWRNLENTWFNSGKAFHKMDSIDGTPNPIFQEWISHPSYDKYWQSMIPYQNEFSHINIPILTTTGYYDDGQRGAMYYYTEHLKYNPDADHYLLIGPYDHWGAQGRPSPNLRGYTIDNVANIEIRNGLVFDWFDYILKGKEKPAILQDKVNFQVMGTNRWMSKPSITGMSNDSLIYYLGRDNTAPFHQLTTSPQRKESPFILNIDFADRSQMNNTDYYPSPIIKDSINLKDGLVFISKSLKEVININGSFSGVLKISSNKKDFDYAINLYELTAEGKYFHLSYYIGRASYAANRENRILLDPNKLKTIEFNNTRIVSKKLSKGSRIVITFNGNKNSFGQINYGTGQDVSNESINDATVPLAVKIHSNSRLIIPVWNN